MPPTFEILKKLVQLQLQYGQSHTPFLAKVKPDVYKALYKALDDATTMEQVMAINLLNPYPNAGFDPLRPIKASSDILADYLPLQFRSSTVEWYAVFGTTNSGTSSVIFGILRFPCISPAVAKETGVPLEDSSLYVVAGGYGNAAGWRTIPFNVQYGQYTRGDSNAFSLVLSGHPNVPTCSMSSSTGKDFQINCDFGTGGQMHTIMANFQAKSLAVPVTKDGCIPCIADVGSLYWSYTNMDMALTAGTQTALPPVESGIGWFDHQWILKGIPNSTPLRFLTNLRGGPPAQRWLWMALQLNDGRQLMLTIAGLKKPPVVGDVFRGANCNVYAADGTVTYALPATVTVLEMTNVQNLSFPTKYRVDIKGSKGTTWPPMFLSTMYPDSLAWITASAVNWEGPCLIADERNAVIGTGMLEASGMASDKETLAGNLQQAGIDAGMLNLFQHQSRDAQLKTWLIAGGSLLGLAALIVLAIWLVRRRRFRRSSVSF